MVSAAATTTAYWGAFNNSTIFCKPPKTFWESHRDRDVVPRVHLSGQEPPNRDSDARPPPRTYLDLRPKHIAAELPWIFTDRPLMPVNCLGEQLLRPGPRNLVLPAQLHMTATLRHLAQFPAKRHCNDFGKSRGHRIPSSEGNFRSLLATLLISLLSIASYPNGRGSKKDLRKGHR